MTKGQGERRRVALSEVADVVTGGTPRAPRDGEADPWGDALDFITPSDQTEGMREADPVRRLSVDGAASLSKKRVPAGATLLTCIGSIGKISRAARPCVTNQQINALIAKPDQIDPDYLYYVALGWADRLRADAVGSTMPIVKKSLLQQYDLEIPNLVAQRRIAHLLTSLDDKIAAGRCVARRADALAAALYDRALARTEAAGDTRALPLASLAEHTPGTYLARDDYGTGGEHPVYGSNSIMGTHTDTNAPANITVLARIGSHCGALRWSDRPAWINSNASAIAPRPGTDPWVLRHALRRIDMRPHTAGSGQPYIRVPSLMSTEIAWPSDTELAAAAPLLAHLGDLERAAHHENERLARTRDELLAPLTNGSIGITGAPRTRPEE